jgi:predicted glycosyltransferase
MSLPRVLFISGSAGLGHVTRDLAIAHQVRALDATAEIRWMAGGPARRVLLEAGEQLRPEAADYGDLTHLAETVHGTVLDYAAAAHRVEAANAKLIVRVARDSRCDVVVGDECYWLSDRLAKHRDEVQWSYVMLIDFFGGDVVKHTVREHAIAYDFNWSWVRWDRRLFRSESNRCLFVGEPEDVAPRSLGLGLPFLRRRCHARKYFTFLGAVLPFEPADWADRDRARRLLGYDARPLIVATIGGTAVGQRLLGLFQAAHPLIRQRLPEARLVLVCGPNVDPQSLPSGDGIELRGFVPDLYQHLAACDVAVTQGGGTTTFELMALRRPFLYFPLEGHFEQEYSVAPRLERYGAGVRMTASQTTPETLAATVATEYGRVADYPSVPVDGARRAAETILSLC